MAKVNIDLEKLVCSLLKQADKTGYKLRMSNLIKALKEQCLEYKDGSLHYIGEEEVKKAVKEACEDIVGESEPFTIKRGKWYKLIKPIGGFSTIGKIYYACYDRHLLVDNNMVCNVEEVSDHFQLVTQAEIKEVEKPATIKFEKEPKKKVKLADLDDDMEELRTTIKEFIRRQKYIDQFEKTNEATEAQQVIGSGEKMLDIDAMVEKYKKKTFETFEKASSYYLAATYRQGLEDMWNKMKKGEITMTQEEKSILLKDLGARLPYKVIIYRGEKDYIGEDDALLEGIDVISGLCELRCLPEGTVFVQDHVSNILPFLRPMSSMTEEERNEYFDIKMQETERVALAEVYRQEAISIIMDWLNSHHFDYRGLIEKGLALEAPKGMYNIE